MIFDRKLSLAQGPKNMKCAFVTTVNLWYELFCLFLQFIVNFFFDVLSPRLNHVVEVCLIAFFIKM